MPSPSLSIPVVAFACLVMSAPMARAQTDDETVIGRATRGPLGENERIHHLLSRLTMGPTPRQFEEVRQKGIAGWLEEQLEAAAPDTPRLVAALKELESLDLSNQEIMKRYVKPIPEEASIEERQRLQRERNVPRAQLLDAVLWRAICSPNQLHEVACDFYRNHFTISVDKDSCRYFATEYERDIIRAGALGTFASLLKATATHPAMLVYLDNAVSRRPLSKTELKAVARRVRRETKSRELGTQAADIAAQRGLNENYARELLELHTLGVDNYYLQRDVIGLAEALTGWSYNGDSKMPVAFCFRGELHVGGNKRFLGTTLRGNSSEPTEGDAVLEMLSTHQGTARFLTWKLCRWLVRDDPSDDMVKRIEKVFWKSRGDMKQVLRAIVDDEEFFARANYQSKFKRPFEYVVGALRVTGAEITDLVQVQRRLVEMSEPYYRCLDPTGFYDQAEAWQDPGAIAVRWKFALDLALGRIKGVRVPDALYADLDPDRPETWKRLIAERIVPAGLSRRTSATIDRMVSRALTDNPFVPMEDVVPKILGAILGSPDFQKQ